MKTIVEELEVIPVTPTTTLGIDEEPDYVKKAQALGFSSVRIKSKRPLGVSSLPYPEIKDEAIQRMLVKRAVEMVTNDRDVFSGYRYSEYYQVSARFSALKWLETPIDKYEGFPPKHILTSLDKAKNTGVFERFAVVTVEEIVDPLLIGITADGRRGLIDHWGQDLTPDEIIGLVD